MVIDSFQTLGNEIKSLKEQLMVKERLAALGEVSAGIAHEFRNPMSVIAGYSKLLIKSFEDTDKRKEIVQSILNEIDEMNRVIEELLKFSGSGPINKKDIDIIKIIGEVLKNIEHEDDSISLASDTEFIVKADEILLKQAIRNLLQNAVDSGGKVWIDAKEGVLSGREGVFINVRDSGRGISADDLNKIFTPFYTTKSGGTGIGLALVQKIAMSHGGSVTVESTEGEGSSFSLFLPFQ